MVLVLHTSCYDRGRKQIMTKKTYQIDGTTFSTLEDFYGEVSRVLIPGSDWGRNLDAFNDILRGGFGTPEGGFILRWDNAQLSREKLGYGETMRYLQQKLKTCHPSNRYDVTQDIEAARNKKGQTLFDILVEIIRDHGKDGDQQDDGVELVLN